MGKEYIVSDESWEKLRKDLQEKHARAKAMEKLEEEEKNLKKRLREPVQEGE